MKRTDCNTQPERNWTALLVFFFVPTIMLVSAVCGLTVWIVPATAEPLAYSLYCLQNIQECPTKGPGTVTHSAKLMRVLQDVQATVNGRIIPRNDITDVWQADVSQGDCDDYVMTKRRRLIRQGIPATAMTVRISRLGRENHVVLVVHTTQGEAILDNLHAKVMFVAG